MAPISVYQWLQAGAIIVKEYEKKPDDLPGDSGQENKGDREHGYFVREWNDGTMPLSLDRPRYLRVPPLLMSTEGEILHHYLSVSAQDSLPRFIKDYVFPMDFPKSARPKPEPGTHAIKAYNECKWPGEQYDMPVMINCMDKNGIYKDNYVVALCDTGAQRGNWITLDFVKRLGISAQVAILDEEVVVETGNGTIAANLSIEIELRSPNGSRYHPCECYIFPAEYGGPRELILGAEFLHAKKVVTLNKNALLPLIKAGRATKEEKARMNDAMEQRRREQQDLEDRLRQEKELQRFQDQQRRNAGHR